MSVPLLTTTDRGLYCGIGDFYLDPWRPVPRAVISHGHSDHACRGCEHYLASEGSERILRARLGDDIRLTPLPFGQAVDHHGVTVSLHPAGHVLGSAQVRLEHRGQVWVFSGDYKLAADPTCVPFEAVQCHAFVTESTFGLPIYRWPANGDLFAEINRWWCDNQARGKASLLFGYALGKSQRILAELDPDIGPIYTHGGVERMTQVYRDSGVSLPPTIPVSSAPKGTDWSRGLILAPPSSRSTPWSRKFGPTSSALASGWMQVRGARRRQAVDRGFVVSDHADWPSLLTAIAAAGAERVYVTHGQVAVLVRWLREQGLEAHGWSTRYEGEMEEPAEEAI